MDMLTTSSLQAELLDWSCAERGLFYQPVKRQLTLRLDADVVAWFKNQTTSDEGYQTRINRALHEYCIAWTSRAVAFSDVLGPLGKEIGQDRAKSYGGAPQSMKMGTIASPWR
jgi:BrnA antitoxin of type II toxin-antitoxin system